MSPYRSPSVEQACQLLGQSLCHPEQKIGLFAKFKKHLVVCLFASEQILSLLICFFATLWEPTSSLFFVLSFNRIWCLRCVSILKQAWCYINWYFCWPYLMWDVVNLGCSTCFRRFRLDSSKLVDLERLDGSDSRFSFEAVRISNWREPSGK